MFAKILRMAGTLAVLGATVGTLCDAMHLHTRTLLYAEPTPMQQPWWVPPLFAGAALGLGLGRVLLARFRFEKSSAERALAATSLFLLAYMSSSVLPDLVSVLVIAALASALLLRYDRTWVGFTHAALSAVAGSLVEITLIDAGYFHYTSSDGPAFMFGIPLWLPLLYVCGAVAVGCFGRYLAPHWQPQS